MKIDKCVRVEMPLSAQLWELYAEAAAGMEMKTPFKQIIERAEFEDALLEASFTKFVLDDENTPVGIALVATDVSKVLWLSPSYFEHQYGNRPVHYLLGVAVAKSVLSRSRLGGKMLLRAVIDNAPPDTILCYDFSQHLHSNLATLGRLMVGKNWSGGIADTLTFCGFAHS